MLLSFTMLSNDNSIPSLIRRMQRPNRMADFLTKRIDSIDSNRFAQNESANRFESRIGMLYYRVLTIEYSSTGCDELNVYVYVSLAIGLRASVV